MRIHLPRDFCQTVLEADPAHGQAWLDHLPERIKKCEARWDIHVQTLYPVSYNFVARCVTDTGKPAVLKICPDLPAFRSECLAIRQFQGRGMVQLLKQWDTEGAMLVEAVEPGILLKELKADERMTAIACDVLQTLWHEADTSEWATMQAREQALKELAGLPEATLFPVKREWVVRAAETLRWLQDTAGTLYFLHGDFHHGNVLLGAAGAVAIDPKGLVGEREADVVQFLLNELPEEPEMVLERRVEMFVRRLGLNRERLLSYGFALSVLANGWSVEAHGKPDKGFFRAMEWFVTYAGNGTDD